MNEREIFIAALRMPNAAERAAFLQEACGDNAELRAQVEQLLREHEQLGSFLEAPAVALVATVDTPISERPGTRIGPYKLLQQIGEGGMGVVWMAEQQEPVRRRVALKVIKPGLDSAQVLARFEAERQALALMDHPHIAKVLDAGATATGRPYFVMELVKGVPITKFCDQGHISPRERLELFIPVCQAVQHAHQKGIIHRDLKPSNVLIAQYDGKPVPKVIDFGVAKASGQKLTERTMFTEVGQIVGTLEYMAPEQAELNNLDIDTRADIYALGAVLYELLTGSPPFTRQQLRSVAFTEMLRLIREVEPPKPSTKLSSSAELPSLAAQRKLEPKRLTRLVHGELDWIVMKALEKDRSRRYETANGLARDLQRYLADEPVEASPPSAGYRLRKVLRKYRKPLITVTAFLVLALLAGAVTAWQAVRLARAERDAVVQQAQREQETQAALGRAETLRAQARAAPAGDLGLWAEARAMARRAEALLEGGPVEPALAERVRTLLRELAEEEKDRRMVAALETIRLRQTEIDEREMFDSPGADRRYSEAFRQYGLDVEALPVAEAVERVRQSAIREELIAALDNWIWSRRERDFTPGEDWWARARWDEDTVQTVLRAVADGADENAWRRAFRAAYAAKDPARLKELVKDAQLLEQRPSVQMLFGVVLMEAKLVEEALAVLRQAQQRYPADLWINHWLAFNLSNRNLAEAIGYYRAAVASYPSCPGVYINLGNALRAQGDLAGAIACFRKAIEFSPKAALAYTNLGLALQAQGDLAGAIVCYRQAIEYRPRYARAHFSLGNALRAQGDLAGAIACFRKVIEIDPKSTMAHTNLGLALQAQRQLDEAIQAFHQALEIDPKSAMAHYSLGNALQAKGLLDEAIQEYRAAIKLDPKGAMPHYSLGRVLRAKNRRDEAIQAFEEAIRLNPKFAYAYNQLGGTMRDLGKWDESIDAYRRAIALDPMDLGHHNGLGLGLAGKGRYDEAIVAYSAALALDPNNTIVRNNLRIAERRLALSHRLPAVLEGKDKPADNAERLELAFICLSNRKFGVAALRLYEEAFAADAKLTDDWRRPHRYNAACAAALAGCGLGKDADQLDDRERARLRRQALAWLRADLQAWGHQLDQSPDNASPLVAQKM